ncbi:4560_t:CDS:1, partial [Acaulospora morrowiae]
LDVWAAYCRHKLDYKAPLRVKSFPLVVIGIALFGARCCSALRTSRRLRLIVTKMDFTIIGTTTKA